MVFLTLGGAGGCANLTLDLVPEKFNLRRLKKLFCKPLTLFYTCQHSKEISREQPFFYSLMVFGTFS